MLNLEPSYLILPRISLLILLVPQIRLLSQTPGLIPRLRRLVKLFTLILTLSCQAHSIFRLTLLFIHHWSLDIHVLFVLSRHTRIFRSFQHPLIHPCISLPITRVTSFYGLHISNTVSSLPQFHLNLLFLVLPCLSISIFLLHCFIPILLSSLRCEAYYLPCWCT